MAWTRQTWIPIKHQHAKMGLVDTDIKIMPVPGGMLVLTVGVTINCMQYVPVANKEIVRKFIESGEIPDVVPLQVEAITVEIGGG